MIKQKAFGLRAHFGRNLMYVATHEMLGEYS